MVVTIAMPITAGTKTAATLSAILAIGAFEVVASSTSLIIFDRVVSSPVLTALILIYPDVTVVPPVTLSPTDLSTGMLSPVIALSSILQFPLTISPSTGMFIPFLQITTSPDRISSVLISTSAPFLSIIAVLGVSFTSLLIADEVLLLLLLSRYFPTVMNVSIIAADSK